MTKPELLTNNTPPKVILFDCDGVMCPPLRFAQVLTEQHQITIEMTREFFSSAFTPALLGHVDVRELLSPYLAIWGWRGSLDDFLTLWLESERGLHDGMITIVESLKQRGFTVGLATNQEMRRAAYLRTEMGFEALFHHLFISCEIRAMKPQDDYFFAVTNTLGIAPGEILFIDDQIHFVSAAQRCGWQAIQFSTAEKLSADLALFLT